MFKDGDEFRRRVRRAAVLLLVPENSVEEVWFQALEDNQDDSPPVMRFKEYVTETRVEGHLQHLNHYDNDGPRTTNAVEGWHLKLNARAGDHNKYLPLHSNTSKKNRLRIRRRLFYWMLRVLYM